MSDQGPTRMRFRSPALSSSTLDFCNEYFGRLGKSRSKSKSSHDLVSEADLNTELLIRNAFGEALSGDAFFGEESGYTRIEGWRGVWSSIRSMGSAFLSACPLVISVAYVLDES